jgi:hypothetical protein
MVPLDNRLEGEIPVVVERPEKKCGAWENRTPDILLAKQALYQLS